MEENDNERKKNMVNVFNGMCLVITMETRNQTKPLTQVYMKFL